MRKENRKGKRLLVLMLVLSVVMSFSFSNVLAETEYVGKTRQGNGGSVSAQSYPVYIYGQFTDSSGKPFETITKADGTVTPTINSSGWVTLGRLSEKKSGMKDRPDRNKYTEAHSYIGTYRNTVIGNLDHLEVYSGNKFTVDQIKAASSWALVSADGANNYVSSGTDTWHLNGQYKVWKLSYDANGGSGTMTDTSGYMNNAPATVKDNQFSRPGYTFIGWSTSANGDVQYKLGEKITMTADKTLYAQWKEKDGVTVTYDGNGGKTSDSKTAFSKSVTPEIEFSVQENQFTKSGYQFTGWNTKKDGSGKSYAAGAGMSVTENTTLYAQWKEKDDVTVTYNGNGGKNADNKTTFTDSVTPEIEFTVQENQFIKSGYQFTGWNIKKDGSGKSYVAGAGMSVTENTTLYAQWKEDANNNGTPDDEEEKYTVTYSDGANGTVFADQVTAGLLSGAATPAFSGIVPNRTGYVFAGWNPIQAAAVTGNAKYTATWKTDANNNGTADDEEQKYTVTYKDGADQKVFKDQTYKDLLSETATPAFKGTTTRSGYKFSGWTPKLDEKVTKNVTYTAVWTKEETPVKPSEPVTPVTPVKPAEEHTVTITPNNGQPDIIQTVPDGGNAVEPDDLKKDGYTIDGYYTDPEMTKAFDFSQPIKSSTHVYVKWTKTNKPIKPQTGKKVTGILLPKVIAAGKHTQTLTWTALKNVDGYFIYTNHCDKADKEYPFKKVATYKASKARVYKVKNLKTGHNYKYYVAAYKIKNGKKVVVRNSVTVHSVAGNTSARSTNVKSVKAKKHSITLKKGKSCTLKASISKMNKKRAFLDSTHCGLLRYLSADSRIATVDYNTGKITAKKAGKTTVYVLGVNGIRDKCTVTVK